MAASGDSRLARLFKLPSSITHFSHPSNECKMGNLLYIIAVILIIGWLLGMFAFHVTGGLIHALLVIAVILFLLQLLSGRRGV